MNVKITTFTNPFSFHCVTDDSVRDVVTTFEHDLNTGNGVAKKSPSDVDHGQYVAVMWKNKWTRGVITMESQFLIWLIDYGIFIHPDDKIVYTDLPVEYRKLPTKVFEAGIHGVTPMDKVINEECKIVNEVSIAWNAGCVQKCQELLKSAKKTYFVPIALLYTKFNDIVLGDLYLEMSGKKMVNIIDELELWPVFLERNKAAYVENLSKYYFTRRKHRASLLKPDLPHLSEVTLQMTLKEYKALDKRKPSLQELIQSESHLKDEDSEFETEVEYKKNKDAYRLTPAEIEKYSQSYITVHGQKYNVLNVLVNKARDLKMCERYKDHDLKSIGRGISCMRTFRDK